MFHVGNILIVQNQVKKIVQLIKRDLMMKNLGNAGFLSKIILTEVQKKMGHVHLVSGY